jgi:hypothetical protein
VDVERVRIAVRVVCHPHMVARQGLKQDEGLRNETVRASRVCCSGRGSRRAVTDPPTRRYPCDLPAKAGGYLANCPRSGRRNCRAFAAATRSLRTRAGGMPLTGDRHSVGQRT